MDAIFRRDFWIPIRRTIFVPAFGTVSATGTITITGDLAAGGGTMFAQGTTTLTGDLAGIGQSIVFGVGTITITGDLVSYGTNMARGTITLLGDTVSDAVHNAFAVTSFIGELQAGGGTQFAQATITLTGDLVADGKNTQAGTITVAGDLVCDGKHLQTGTTTLIGDLSAIGTNLADNEVNAFGTITMTGDVAASGTQLASGTSTLTGDLVAVGQSLQPAVGTITMTGDLAAYGTHMARGTITILGTGITDAVHLAQGTITLTGDLAAIGQGFVYPTATITISGDLVSHGTSLASGTSTLPGDLIADGRHTDITATTTLIGELAAIGTDISSGIVNAFGTITMSGDLLADGTSLASGTSTLTGNLVAVAGAVIVPATGLIHIGSHFGDVVLQLLLDGPDGATNTSDTSLYEHAMTFRGNADLDNTEKPFPSEQTSSLRCQGSNDWIDCPYNSAFDMGDHEWTLEGFDFFDVEPESNFNGDLISLWEAGQSNRSFYALQIDGQTNGVMRFVGYDGSIDNSVNFELASGKSAGVWYHWAIVRDKSGGEDRIRAWFDEEALSAVVFDTDDFTGITINDANSGRVLKVGDRGSGGDDHQGYKSLYRFTNNVALYRGTSNISAPGGVYPHGELRAVGTSLAFGTITLIGDAAGVGEKTVLAVGTITMTGELGALGTDIGPKFAAGTITIPGQLLTDPKSRGFGTSTMPGTLAAFGIGITPASPAVGTITITGDLVADGFNHCPLRATASILISGSLVALEDPSDDIVPASGSIAMSGTLGGSLYHYADDGNFLGHGTIAITGDLEAKLTEPCGISATATIRWIGLAMSAGMTDPDLFVKTATINIIGSLSAPAVYYPEPTITLAGELTALGRVLPEGNLGGLAGRSTFQTSGQIGAGTIDGRKTAIINQPYGSIELYNNSQGGFYSIGNAQRIKEAFALMNFFGSFSAIGSVDQTKFGLGVIDIPGDLVSTGRHTMVEGIVNNTGQLDADGTTLASATITMTGTVAATGIKPFAPTYNGAQSPTSICAGTADYESVGGPGINGDANSQADIWLRNSAGDTIIRRQGFEDGGDTDQGGAASSLLTIFTLNDRADTVRIRLVSGIYDDTDHANYPSTSPKIGSFTDDSDFNATNAVNYGYRANCDVESSDPGTNPPTPRERGQMINIIEFTFKKAGFEDLVVTYKATANALTDSADEFS